MLVRLEFPAADLTYWLLLIVYFFFTFLFDHFLFWALYFSPRNKNLHYAIFGRRKGGFSEGDIAEACAEKFLLMLTRENVKLNHMQTESKEPSLQKL
jgi:hypothetical protein